MWRAHSPIHSTSVLPGHGEGTQSMMKESRSFSDDENSGINCPFWF